MGFNWTYIWKYPQLPESKYDRLYHAQKILEISRHVMLLDTVEPVMDFTEANIYLDKFRLKNNYCGVIIVYY